MESGVRRACVVDAPLDVSAHLQDVRSDEAGAVDIFIGQVRNHDPHAQGAVTRLDYEAHPDAEAILRGLADDAAAKHGVLVATSHRIGSLDVGDVAVVIACSAAHRAAALDATRDLIENIKQRLPIWKRQDDASGRSQWIGIS